jgi:RHS repeat-associated protein
MDTREGGCYITGDHLGSTNVVTAGSTAAIVSETEYYPFGAIESQSAPSPTDRMYTGQLRLTPGEIYDYGSRLYNAYTGRFLKADTIVPEPGNPQSLNRYSYVVNNPMRYTDPTGHRPSDGGNDGGTMECWSNGQIDCSGEVHTVPPPTSPPSSCQPGPYPLGVCVTPRPTPFPTRTPRATATPRPTIDKFETYEAFHVEFDDPVIFPCVGEDLNCRDSEFTFGANLEVTVVKAGPQSKTLVGVNLKHRYPQALAGYVRAWAHTDYEIAAFDERNIQLTSNYVACISPGGLCTTYSFGQTVLGVPEAVTIEFYYTELVADKSNTVLTVQIPR